MDANQMMFKALSEIKELMEQGKVLVTDEKGKFDPLASIRLVTQVCNAVSYNEHEKDPNKSAK